MNNSKLNVVLHRDGDVSPITLDRNKCLIRTVQNSKKIDCCAIFNGPYGTALRSYTDNVLVNGEPTAARWLNAGDQIQLPCLTRLEVKAATSMIPLPAQTVKSDSNESPVSAPENVLDGLQTVESILAPELQTPSVEVATPDASALEAAPVEAPPVASVESEEEETFHSPFSQDLPEFVAPTPETPAVAEVQQAAEIPQALPTETVTTDKAAPESTTEPAAEDLESIFARMGVTNVGSIANPGAAAEAVAPTAGVAGVENNLAAPAQETQSETSDIRKELEPVLVEKEPTIADVPATPQPVAAPSVEPVATVEASTPTLNETVGQPAADPLSELPDDLRNQLNSLVSSLEDESPTATENKSVLESLVPAAAATTAAAAVAASIPAISDLVQPASKPQPVEPMQVAEEAKPVRDEEISSMFDDVLRSIQDDPKPVEAAVAAPAAVSEPVAPVAAAAPAAVESVAPISPVETAAVEPARVVPTVPETPVAAVEPQPEKPKSQSVADILGAMGMEVPGDDEAGFNQPENPTPAPVTPAPVQTPEAVEVQAIPSGQVFDGMAPEEEASATDGDAEDDIQAYMNKLLNRGAAEAKPAVSESETEPAKPPVTDFIAPPVVEPVEPPAVLSADEFVPNHKPSRPQNYDTLREIANTSSRSAIHRSNEKAQKGSVALKVVFGLISVLLAFGSFSIGQPIVSVIFVAVAAMCLVSLFLKQKSPRKPSVVSDTNEAQA